MRPSHPHLPCSNPLAAPLLLLALPSQPPPHRPASPRATSGPGNGGFKGMGRSGGRALQPPLFPASPSGFFDFSRRFFGGSGARKYNFTKQNANPKDFLPPVFWFFPSGFLVFSCCFGWAERGNCRLLYPRECEPFVLLRSPVS